MPILKPATARFSLARLLASKRAPGTKPAAPRSLIPVAVTSGPGLWRYQISGTVRPQGQRRPRYAVSEILRGSFQRSHSHRTFSSRSEGAGHHFDLSVSGEPPLIGGVLTTRCVLLACRGPSDFYQKNRSLRPLARGVCLRDGAASKLQTGRYHAQ